MLVTIFLGGGGDSRMHWGARIGRPIPAVLDIAEDESCF